MKGIWILLYSAFLDGCFVVEGFLMMFLPTLLDLVDSVNFGHPIILDGCP